MNRLKSQLEEKGKKEEIEPKEKFITEAELKDVLDLELINSITEDVRLVNFLKENTIKLFNIQARSVILIGEVLTTVFDELSKQGSTEGIYEKWLKLNNYNKQTALRYRKRYFVYNEVKDEEKNVVLTLPQSAIDKMYENKEFIELLNSGISKSELIGIVNNAKIDNSERDKIPEFVLDDYKKIFIDFDTKMERLDKKDKVEVQKYLEKIKNILNKKY